LGVLAATADGAGEIMKGDGLQSLVLLLTQQCSNHASANDMNKQEEEESLCAALDLFLKIARHASLRTLILCASAPAADGGIILSAEANKLLFLVHSVCVNVDGGAVLESALSLVTLLCTPGASPAEVPAEEGEPVQRSRDGNAAALLAAQWLAGVKLSPTEAVSADIAAPPPPQSLQLPRRAADILRSPTSSMALLRSLATALEKITSVEGIHMHDIHARYCIGIHMHEHSPIPCLVKYEY
jgi:hypothetical protein